MARTGEIYEVHIISYIHLPECIRPERIAVKSFPDDETQTELTGGIHQGRKATIDYNLKRPVYSYFRNSLNVQLLEISIHTL